MLTFCFSFKIFVSWRKRTSVFQSLMWPFRVSLVRVEPTLLSSKRLCSFSTSLGRPLFGFYLTFRCGGVFTLMEVIGLLAMLIFTGLFLEQKLHHLGLRSAYNFLWDVMMWISLLGFFPLFHVPPQSNCPSLVGADRIPHLNLSGVSPPSLPLSKPFSILLASSSPFST